MGKKHLTQIEKPLVSFLNLNSSHPQWSCRLCVKNEQFIDSASIQNAVDVTKPYIITIFQQRFVQKIIREYSN